MSDENPQPSQPESNEILDELREMGRILRDALQGAWDSAERKQVQQDIEEGLAEVRVSLGQAFQEFKETPTGQTIQTEVADFKERVRAGEVEAKARSEVLHALRVINAELRKVGKKPE